MTARVLFVALAWVAAFTATGLGASWALAALPWHPGARWWLAWSSLGSAVGFGLATVLVGRLLDRRSWEALGWRPRTGIPRALVLGVGVGAVMAAVAVALAMIAGRAAVLARQGTAAPTVSWAAAAGPLGVGLLLAALTEELMFRGYPLRRLADGIGTGPAVAFIAVGFGLAHLGNPGATVFSTVNVALAGVWLAAAFFSPGGMPLAWGAHFGWNATLALGFAAPVSGYTFALPAIEYHPGPHGWIDGGAFGPEGGAVTTLVMVAGAFGFVTWTRGRRAGSERVA